MKDEEQSKSMKNIFVKKYAVLIYTVLLTCSCTNEHTFTVSDVRASSNLSEEHIQETREQLIGTEVNLLFSDNDVRIIVNPQNKETESMILQKIGHDLYRGNDGADVIDLELNSILGYIRSCKISAYDKKNSGSSMIWCGTIFLKRK